MIWNNLIESGIYLVCVYVLFWLGKLVYDLTTPSYKLKAAFVRKIVVVVRMIFVGNQ